MLNFKKIYYFILNDRNTLIEILENRNKLNKVLVKYSIDKNLFYNLFINRFIEYTQIKLENRKSLLIEKHIKSEVINELYKQNFSIEDIQYILCEIKDAITLLSFQSTLSKNELKLLYKLQNKLLKKIIYSYSKKILIKRKINEKQKNIVEEHLLLTTTDRFGKITSATDAFCKLMGYTKEEVVGKTHRIFRDPEVPSDYFKKMWDTILKGDEWESNIQNKTKDNQIVIVRTKIIPIKNDSNNIVQFIAIRDDITEKEESKYDGLTKLYNRNQFDKRFKIMLEELKKNEKSLNLIILDADDFKHVNDTYGHKKGDEVLISISNIISENTRKSDLCARWGGEEFVIALPNSKIDIAQKIANRIKDSIASNIVFENQRKQTCSFGISTLINDDNTNSIFERADQALYKAKKTGKNKIEVF